MKSNKSKNRGVTLQFVNNQFEEKQEMSGLIHHMELYVSNLERSRKFWGWLLGKLGYNVYQQWEQGISWKKGSTYIVLVQTKEKYLHIPYHRCGTGLNHIAFHVSSRTEIDDLVAEMKNSEIKILYGVKYPPIADSDYYAVYFEDPDRIKVELVAP
jgi:catechol 2,3-dioxygenase-like lactoylglutathione lyase family enzyme